MNLNILKKSCPNCKKDISVGLFSNKEKIIRCPQCRVLLIDNPVRSKIGSVIIILGIILGLSCRYLFGLIAFWGLLIIIISVLTSMLISNLKIIKMDLVIRNKKTNEISYINQSDWNDILNGLSDKENNFEIIEELK